MVEHKCDKINIKSAEIEILFEEAGISQWGPAVGQIIKVGNRWFAYNEEYATPILYCPFCGIKL